MIKSEQYLEITTPAGQALIKRSSVEAIRALDGVIFDCDGVLVDVSRSIQLVHKETAGHYFGNLGWTNCTDLVEPEDVDAFKIAGRFNSDWHCAYSWQLLYLYKSMRYESTDCAALKASEPTLPHFIAELKRRGGGLQSAVDVIQEMCSPNEWADLEARWDRDAVQRIFVEVYSGDLCGEIYGFEPEIVKGQGLIVNDRSLLDRNYLPEGLNFGIATGRTAGETMVGMRLLGLSDIFPPESIVSEDDGFKKPDPRILALAVERLGLKHASYIGDTPDDLLTVTRFKEIGGEMLSFAVVTGHFKGDKAKKRFIELGADIVADNVNAVLSTVTELKKS